MKVVSGDVEGTRELRSPNTYERTVDVFEIEFGLNGGSTNECRGTGLGLLPPSECALQVIRFPCI